MESACSGIVAGINAYRSLMNMQTLVFPNDTMIGALSGYISDPTVSKFQPMGANFGVLPELENKPRDKKERAARYSSRALLSIDKYIKDNLQV